jgi:hypothetical protein
MAPWDKLALQYFDSINQTLTEFNSKIFEVKIPDNDLKQNLRARLPGLERSALQHAKDYLTHILRYEKQEILQTVNNYFPATAFSIQEERVSARLRGMGQDIASRSSN